VIKELRVFSFFKALGNGNFSFETER